MSASTSTWIIIPAYKEGAVIGNVLSSLMGSGYSVVVIDDGSPDDTARIAQAAGAHVIRHPVNLGQGASLQTGLDFALRMGADFLVTFDADGQHRPADIKVLLEPLSTGQVHYTLGSRRLGGVVGAPRLRRAILTAAAAFMRVVTGAKLTDAHNGLRGMTRLGAEAIQLRENRMAHASEIISQIVKSKLAYVEVPVTVHYSTYSLAKGQKSSDTIKILVDLAARKLRQ